MWATLLLAAGCLETVRHHQHYTRGSCSVQLVTTPLTSLPGIRTCCYHLCSLSLLCACRTHVAPVGTVASEITLGGMLANRALQLHPLLLHQQYSPRPLPNLPALHPLPLLSPALRRPPSPALHHPPSPALHPRLPRPCLAAVWQLWLRTGSVVGRPTRVPPTWQRALMLPGQ